MQTEPVKYLVARIREALAEDPRTNVLDIEVKISGDQLFLLGPVESHERREAVEAVVRESIPVEWAIVNELWVPDYSHRTAAERVP
jgi:osmotically-inducible protein OsmY